MIALDLDGTLLDDEKNLSEYSVEILRAAIAAGIQIVPATGRDCKGIRLVLDRLPEIRYAILMNGAQVLDLTTGQILRSADIPQKDAEEIFDYLDTLPVIYDCFQDGEMWTPVEHYMRIVEYSSTLEHAKKMQRLKMPVDHFRTAMRERNAPCQKIHVAFKDQKARDPELAQIQARFPQFAVTTSLPINIEITAKEATKGSALQFLSQQLGVAVSDVMAVGDSENDLSMFQAAGLSVAMANAAEAVKANAMCTTESNHCDGAARAVKKYIEAM